jgi:hypothetical protein
VSRDSHAIKTWGLAMNWTDREKTMMCIVGAFNLAVV